MRRATITSVMALFFVAVSLAQTGNSDTYQGFRIGMGLAETMTVAGGNLEKGRALCTNPPKHLSDKEQTYFASVCPKIERTLAGQPTEWEFPKEQLRLAFDKGHVIRVTDFNGVVHLQEAQTQTAVSTLAPTMPTQIPSAQQPQATVQVQDQDVAAASRAMRQAKTAQAASTASPVSPQTATPARQTKPSIAAKVEPINDAFAKASLRALMAIQGDATLPDVTQGGEILFSKKVVDVIDEADSEARADAETRLLGILRALHIRHSTNNMELAAKEELAKATYHYTSTSDLGRQLETLTMLQKDPTIAGLKSSPKFQNEEDCATGLERLFRARKSGPIPEPCAASDNK